MGHLWVWIWIEAGELCGSIAIDWNCSIMISLFLGLMQLHGLLFGTGYHTFLYASRSAVTINPEINHLLSSIDEVTPHSRKTSPLAENSEMLP